MSLFTLIDRLIIMSTSEGELSIISWEIVPLV